MSGIPSKKRDIGQINGDNQRANDHNTLFGGERRGNLQGYNEAEDNDEALEDDNLYNQDDDEGRNSDVEPEGDDLIENMEDDYNAVPELDNYEAQGIDDLVQSELSLEGRAEVDRKLEQEQRLQANMQGRRPGALMDNEDDEEDELIQQQIRQERLRMMREGLGGDQGGGGGGDDGDDPDGIANALDFEDVRGPLFIWLKKPDVIKFVNRQFDQFLRRFQNDDGKYLYEEKIHEMCQNNKQSLEIVFSNLSQKFPTLAIWLAEEPKLMLDIINHVASDVVSEVYPDYYKIHDKIFIRVKDLPVEDKLRDLRQVHLNALIKIRGVVTKRTQVFPELKEMYYRCQTCQDLKGPLYNNSSDDAKQFLGQCIICQKNGPYIIEDHKSIYRNYQKWTMQETPGSVPPGRVPRQKEVFILNDLVDTARPGDEVEITGIFINKFDYGANIKHGFPVFQTVIEANNVRRFGDEDIVEITDEDKAEIKRLSKESNIDKLIFDSVAPSIYGHDFIKKGLCLAMFGGVPKDIGGKHKIRGDINMLLLGDPGTAKSQFLKYVEQICPRVVYTTGKGASAVGLTAGVHKDPVTQEWVLEAGALVLADKGVCLIDEFDKMNDQDRTSIHEAMEQQSISISKAGIVTSLQARCSVIAAANPIKGVYNIQMNFNDNVDLTDPILSRFDQLAVVKDEVDEEYDDALASFVINSHMKNHPNIMKMYQRTENEGLDQAEKDQQVQEINQQVASTALPNNRLAQKESVIPQEMLKKYLIYSKKFMKPKLNEIDQDKITQFYSDIRRESSVVGGIPIAVRHIESVIRMSEAKAKIGLRDHVSTDDIDFAIDMLLQSFLQSQKMSVSRQLSKKFEKYRYRQTDKSQLLLHILKDVVKERAIYNKAMEGIDELEKVKVSFKKNLFEERCREYARHNMTDFYNSFSFKKDFVLEGDLIQTKNKV